LEHKEFFSIGEAGKICNISKKTLRFYSEIGLLSPDMIGDNEYRYYSRDTLLTIPVIKYYKQMGFKLDELRDFIHGGTYAKIAAVFKEKIDSLEAERAKINEQSVSVADWYDLILEASLVIEMQATDVGVKYFETIKCLFLDQPFNSDHKDAIINIEFTNFVESIGNEITGPVMRKFDSWRSKLAGTINTMRMLQRTILQIPDELCHEFGGSLMASCYHIGDHENLGETYRKICKWAATKGYVLSDGSYERYVTDHWTTLDTSQHVTEVIIPVLR
jgi:DNA-binding transcriptional MerR regulator